jgi:hypothetical protein
MIVGEGTGMKKEARKQGSKEGMVGGTRDARYRREGETAHLDAHTVSSALLPNSAPLLPSIGMYILFCFASVLRMNFICEFVEAAKASAIPHILCTTDSAGGAWQNAQTCTHVFLSPSRILSRNS